MAWLSSVPAAAQRTPAAQRDMRTRGERLRDDGADHLPVPPVAAGGQLIEWFFDVGPVAAGGMGPVPLAYTDLQAWAQITGAPLEPWQATTLRRMSRAYVAELRTAEDPAAVPPWTAPPTQQDRDAVARHLRDALGTRATPKGRT